VGAKVNGRIMPLKYHMRNGDIVEIITQAGHAPSRDWLGLVNTSRARNKIKHWINVANASRHWRLASACWKRKRANTMWL